MRVQYATSIAIILIATILVGPRPGKAAETPYRVGVGSVDITPDYPIRLSGFGNRTTESEGVTSHLFAKAMAIADSAGKNPVVLVAVDNVGIPAYVTQEVAGRLAKSHGVDPTRFTITSTHTHSGPMLSRVLGTIFGAPIPEDQQQRIDQYTRELTDNIEKAANAALDDLKPASLQFGIGEVDFAINRRTPGGPTDHDLPILVVRNADDSVRAIYVSYACHCVTLSENKISGDWAGYVQEIVQKNYPDAVAITSVGCGGDQNPSSGVTGANVAKAVEQGQAVATEVDRLLKTQLKPISGAIATKLNHVDLPFDTLPTREEWEARAKQPGAVGYHAQVQLARLDRGEKLQTSISYPIQTWAFGDQLAVVFLGGEVTVDYSIRLKHSFDRTKLWINAYSNDVPCYIPSERVLKEGGYEGGGAMIYYDRPTSLAPGLEDKIIGEVKNQLSVTFPFSPATEGVIFETPEQSRRSIKVPDDLKVELVAAEPLVTSPVAIDWDRRGRLWVCEMYDYPTGADNNWKPGGRVRFLEDTDHDGVYDKSTLFLENIPFPTGITAFGDGVLVCAAPDILYAEDTDHDGKADKTDKRFSGFATDNYQARVNSLSLGLDNWMYGANGLLGGNITFTQAGVEKSLDIRGHDFRFTRDFQHLETVAGLTQQGRVRDDWGRWFGCNNSQALTYYPNEERYFLRNSSVAAPSASIDPPGDFDIGRVYPISRTLERFNEVAGVNRVTSGCGVGVYRDTLLGEAYFGNTFTAEPVHNLVHRLIVSDDDAQVVRKRAETEKNAEFLASSDNWSRFVDARTGPDGALYVVDMYRFLIEHPRWIPAERLAKIDVRAGADKGRIYRVIRPGVKLRAVADLAALSTADAAARLDSPNGTERDRVHADLLFRNDPAAASVLASFVEHASLPQVRLQALCALDGLGVLKPEELLRALGDEDAHVRMNALRIAEKMLKNPADDASRDLLERVVAMTADASARVRKQLAFSLGECDDARAGVALAKLAAEHLDDADLRFAVLSSAAHHSDAILTAVRAAAPDAPGRDAYIPPLVATAVASGDDHVMMHTLDALLPTNDAPADAATFVALASLSDALAAKNSTLSGYVEKQLPEVQPRLNALLARASETAVDVRESDERRVSAVRIISSAELSGTSLESLIALATTEPSDAIRSAAMAALGRSESESIATKMLAHWPQVPPANRPAIVTFLLTRDAWATALLNAVIKHGVQPNEIPLTDRQRLVTNDSEAIKSLAAKALPERIAAGRADVILKYASVPSLVGDADDGRALFTKNCASCHLIGDVGHDIGPSLSALRDKDVDYFVKNILDPNAIIEPRFVNYVINLNDRRQLSGIIKAETSTSITLAAGGSAAIESIDRAKVKEIRATTISMMPEGFESALSPQQLANVIAYIRGSAVRKTLAGNAPVEVLPAKDGAIVLRANTAEFYGNGPIVFESEFGNVGYWSAASDYVAWTTNIKQPTDYDVYIDFACAASASGNTLQVSAGDQTLSHRVAATGDGWQAYQQTKIGSIHVPAGQSRIVVKPDGAVKEALCDLRAVALVPAGVKPDWQAAAPPPARASATAEIPRTPAEFAAVILDSSRTADERDAVITANPQFAGELTTELTRNIAVGTDAEYERIPWIWRVAVTCGKRNDANQIRRLLDVALPKVDQPLHDWQAVVVGGGIINGISQQDVWPGPRLAEIVADDQSLHARWQHAVDLAAAMAEDVKIRPGTRYDALRMLGVEPWSKVGEMLQRYLGDANAELQMGAVSALADVDANEATSALVIAVPSLTPHNRQLALNALMRTPDRMNALLDAVEIKRVDRTWIEDNIASRLTTSSDPDVKRRAGEVLSGSK